MVSTLQPSEFNFKLEMPLNTPEGLKILQRGCDIIGDIINIKIADIPVIIYIVDLVIDVSSNKITIFAIL